MEDPNFKQARIDKLAKIKTLGWTPYGYSFDKKQTIAQALQSESKTVKTAGKLFSLREHGNIAFADLKDETGRIQLFLQKKLLGEETYKNLKLLDIGDYMGVEGEVIPTTAGEISIAPTSYTLLSKALLPLPSEFFGVKDTETRYRQRYLDLLINPEVRERFNMRSKVVSAIRRYLDMLGFWEVETPTLQPLYGGANAKPFVTHANALNRDVYLRIADELYLKRLIVGGYERVYEICKDFRNEGIDHTHFPEFTMIEWYEAYADYQRVMDVAEGLFKHIANGVFGHTRLKIDDKEIDIGHKWPRIRMVDIMKEKLDLDVEAEDVETLREYMQTNCKGAGLVGGETKGQLIFAIFDHTIPKLLIEPTWIIDYPADISPLAKPHREKDGWVERFEGYIGGKEICDGWSELTDPIEQRKRWQFERNAARADKEEAQHVDEDFLTAMEYGMPPLGGIGIGIDRITMFFTNNWAIKEVVLFPNLRSDVSLSDKNTVTEPASAILKKQTPHDEIALQDFSRKMVIIVNKDLLQWQVLNTIAHISAYLGNRMPMAFDTGESFDTSDHTPHPRNTQYPIIVLAASGEQLRNTIQKVRVSGLLYHGFIREMIETTDDAEIERILSQKKEEEIEYLGVGMFGDKEQVDTLTKKFSVWK